MLKETLLKIEEMEKDSIKRITFEKTKKEELILSEKEIEEFSKYLEEKNKLVMEELEEKLTKLEEIYEKNKEIASIAMVNEIVRG